MSDLSELSQRELEILKLVATGASNKEIAQELYISSNTVKVHLRNIFNKIGVNSRTEAAMYAVTNNLVGSATPLPPVIEESASPVEDGPEGGPAMVSIEDDTAGQTSRFKTRILIAALGALIILGAVIAVVLARNPAVQATLGAPPASAQAPRWIDLAEMPTARAGPAVAVYDNKIFSAAGMEESGASGILEQYDPVEDRWIRLSDKPTPVGDAEAAVVGGQVYVPGGLLATGETTDVVEMYDPASDSWGRAASLPVPISSYALSAFEGSIYLFGGWDGQEHLASVYRYDPKQNEWTLVAELPQPRSGAAAAVNGGKIYIAGGRNEGGLLAGCAAFLPNLTGAEGSPWEPVAALPEARADLGLTSVVDTLYAIGGETQREGGPIDSYALLPQEDAWQVFDVAEAPFPQGAGITSVGRNLYVFGGRAGEQLTGENRAYQVLYTISIPVLVK